MDGARANETRLHSSIGYTSPVEFEAEYYRHNNTRSKRCWENRASTEPGAIHTDRQAHDLELELFALLARVLTCQRLITILTRHPSGVVDPH